MQGCNTPTGYHDEYLVIEDNDINFQEVCITCSERFRTRKTEHGQLIDNNEYIDFHAKDYLQSGTREFRRVYGIEQELKNYKRRAEHLETAHRRKKVKADKEELYKHIANKRTIH